MDDSAEELYENAPCGYLSTLPDGTIVKVNATFLAWTGHRREELVGKRRFADLLSVGGRIYHETHLAPLLRMQGTVTEIALEIVRADGRRLPVLVNSTVKAGDEGAPLLIRTTVFDATARKAYERELLAARDRERAAHERTERLQRLTALLAGAQSVEEVGAEVVPELRAGTGADVVIFATRDEQGRIEVVARHGGAGDPGLAGVLEPRFEQGAALPLIVRGRPVGVLWLGFDGAHVFSEADRAFLLACAAQCAQALDRAQLHRQSMRSARESAFHAELSRVLDQVHGFDERAGRLVELVAGHVGDRAWLELRPDAAGEPRIDGDTVVVPLGGIGALVIAGRRFGPEDVPFLAELGDRAALALDNARLYDQQRDVALTLQRSLLADSPPSDPRLQVGAHYQPAIRSLEVGGDWYDMFATGPDRVAIVVGDVVGRGIVAASAMGQLRSAVRALAIAGLAPGELIGGLDAFATQIEPARWATLVYAELDLGSGRVRYAVAGHPPPLVIEPGAAPRALWEGRSPPLGIGGARPEAELTLRPGARLLLYTDGLVERRDVALDAGLERLVAALERDREASVSVVAAGLADAMLVDADHDDDVCLLLVGFG